MQKNAGTRRRCGGAAIEQLEYRTLLSGAAVIARPVPGMAVARMAAGPIMVQAAAADAPSNLSATAASQGAKAVVNLTWTNNCATAKGYLIFRSTNGVSFDLVTRVDGIGNTKYSDPGLAGNTTYYYMVLASMASGNSAASKIASVKTPAVATAMPTVAAPINVAAQMTVGPDGNMAVGIFWMDGSRANAGNSYKVLRSVDGGALALIATVKGQMYTDTTTAVDTRYQYQVIAVTPGGAQSAASTASLTTSPGVPSNLAATSSNGTVRLSWDESDTKVTGYTIFTSANGSSFTQAGQVNGYGTRTWTSGTLADGIVAFYKVYATGPGGNSTYSNVASARVASSGTGVSISQRFSTELVVNATGDSDSIQVTQSGNQLLITANGKQQTQTVPAGGLFIYLRGGRDSVQLDQSVTARVTVQSIDSAVSTINSSAANVQAWIDATDLYSGSGNVHKVSSFVGGVSTKQGASLPNPTDFSSTVTLNYSLFGTGPVAADANQGQVGDCYCISTFAALATTSPATLYDSVVDMGDGTYTVQFMSGGTPSYVRVSNQFTVPQAGYSQPFFARYGANKTVWAMVLEKAYAYVRRGTNTYTSLNGGYFGEVYDLFGVKWQTFSLNTLSDTSLFATLSSDLASGKPVNVATTLNPPDLVMAHGYTLVGVTKVNGVNMYQVRNPWGCSGGKLENSSGIASLTYAQLTANMAGGTVANV